MSKRKELTKRECEVLEHISNGLCMKTISSKLYVSHHTVISHYRNLREKLEAKNTAHAVSIAYKQGYLKV